MAFISEKCFVVRDCTMDNNRVTDDFMQANEEAMKITCRHFGNKMVIIPAIIFYKVDGIPKYVGLCSAKSKKDMRITWYNATDNLMYAIDNKMLDFVK